MSENTKWTNEQREAITEKDCSLLVAAAAGAGKTAVLVERIICKITNSENPVDIDRLLVVTFTNAAAAEMRERIAEAISAALERDPGSRNIQRQMTLLSKASITTIHSFCLEVIRSNFQYMDIDPGFRITDETEAALMKLEVLNELFEDQYETDAGNADFIELLECYGGNRDDRILQDMVLNLYNFIQSSPWPERWLSEMIERFRAPAGPDFGETVWGRVLLQSVMLELEGLRETMSRAVETLKPAAGLDKYLAVYLDDLNGIDALSRLCEKSTPIWDILHDAFASFEFDRLPNAGKDADKAVQEYVRNIRDDVKSRIKSMKERIFAARSNEILNDLNTLYPLMKCLSKLVSAFGERYAAKKMRKSVVDFNDLEHFCLGVLSIQDEDGSIRPSKAASGYRERFTEILVDEYQDSNPVQEIIINMISKTDAGRPNVFMVGDVKQSIYRFRQAKPELFLDKYNSYTAESGSLFRKILLFKNFRSRREIINSVNFIFKQIMSVNVGELDYTDTETLNAGAVFAENENIAAITGGETEFHLIQTGGTGDETAAAGAEPFLDEKEYGAEDLLSETGGETSGEPSGNEDEPDNIQCEARLAAKRIRDLMLPDGQGKEFCIYDKTGRKYRKIEYRDIVILLRTTRNWSDVFMEELGALGIPAFADTGTGFFKTSEVQVILSLLQVIDNPLQDIPLISVLRSPIVSFTTGELAELRLADRKASLHDALKALAEGGLGRVSEKASAFLKDLRRWREMSLYMSTDRLIWQLYNETGYYGILGAMPAGEQRQANLRILFERARRFEETSFKGLFNFINFIDKLKSGKGDMGSAKMLGENDNVVRIMSIHKSKGLEFPVVILAGCGKKFNLQDMNKSILLHQELGFGPDVVDYKRRLSYPSIPKQAIREKIKAETLSEEMRILYVAMTRAREKLIITGTVSDIAKAAVKWARCAGVRQNRLPVSEMLKAGRFLDWIGPALLRHMNCSGLRDCTGTGTGLSGSLIEDPSVWSFRIWNKGDIPTAGTPGEQDEAEFIRWLDGLGPAIKTDGSADRISNGLVDGLSVELYEEAARRLSWEYPCSKASVVPAKVSVTELKRRFDTALSENAGSIPEFVPVLVRKPMFLEARKGLSAAEAGTVLHFVMQHLDFGRNDIEVQVGEMAAGELLTRQQAESIETDKIRRFLESSLGKRLAAAGSIKREAPFNMEIPCSELYSDMDDEAYRGETMLLQGVIDCWFEEPDGLVLLDYKTDYVPAGKTEMIRDRYRLQISYYSRALELLAGKRVKEKYIYLFWNGEILDF